MIKKRIHWRLTGISPAVIQGVVRLPFDSRRDRSRQGCWNGTEKERMQWRAVYGGGLMSRRRYILEQVFTRAGCTRYLHTFGSSGARSRSYVRVYAAWSLERERKRGEKKVNGRGPWERDPHGCFSLSRCWFRREKIDSACTQVLAILFFFSTQKESWWLSMRYRAMPRFLI